MMPRAPFFSLLVVSLVCSLSMPASALGDGATLPLQSLVGEEYRYAIDFLVFTRLAAGELRLVATDRPNIYRAELIGRTLGIASWLAGDRTQTYTSLMELTADGSLRSIEHESRIVKRRWGKWQNRERHYRYDYQQGKVFDVKLKEGVPGAPKEHTIPPGRQPVDMLTAFYNLRTGVYGALERGARIRIPTFSSKGFSEITADVLTPAQQARQSFFPAHGLLVQVNLDPEIFDTSSGNLYIWFDDGGVPGRGIVEDLIGMGDVRGYLDQEGL